MDTLGDLNAADDARALSILNPLIEKAPDLAKKVAAHRPFQSTEQLSLVIRRELLGLNKADRIALFRAHPELAPDNPLEMTNASQREQNRLNLTSKGNERGGRLAELNTLYRQKFGFPFITALVRHQDMDSILDEFESRLSNDLQAEIETAIDQIATVSANRVQAAFECDETAASPAGRNPHSTGWR